MATAQQISDAAARRVTLLGIIRTYVQDHGYAPNLTELGHLTGVHRETIKKDLGVLEREGLIERGPMQPAGRPVRLRGYRAVLVETATN